MQAAVLTEQAVPRPSLWSNEDGTPLGATSQPYGNEIHEATLSQLNSRGFVQFHTVIAEKLDNFKAAIFLGHALYWARYQAIHHPYRDGWFFMTAREWERATGLSVREQTAVRAQLVEQKLLMEALADHPAKLHFKVNLPVLTQWLGMDHRKSPSWDVISQLSTRCVSFYKPLADVSGSVATGLYLSYLLDCQRRLLNSSVLQDGTQSGYFAVRLDDVRIALCLGPKTQRNARDKLKRAGFVSEGRSNATSSELHIRLNMQAIHACLVAQDGAPLPQRRIKTTGVNQGTAATAHATPRLARVPEASEAPNPVQLNAGRSDELLIPARVRQPQPPKTASIASSTREGFSEARFYDRRKMQLPLFGPLEVKQQAQSGVGQVESAALLTLRLITANPAISAKQLVGSEQPGNPRSSGVAQGASALLSKLETPVALLSKLACPFVETALPFCRNIQKVLKTNTTTTTGDGQASVEASTGNRRSSRIGISKLPKKLEAISANASPDLVVPPAIVVTELEDTTENGQPNTCLTGIATPTAIHISLTGFNGAALLLPKALDTDWHPGVLKALATAPAALRQPLLDELEGQLSIAGKTIHNPAGWLYSLLTKERQGTLVLAMADKVAGDRERRAQIVAQVAQVKANTEAKPNTAGQGNTESDPAVKAKYLREIREKLGLKKRESKK